MAFLYYAHSDLGYEYSETLKENISWLLSRRKIVFQAISYHNLKDVQ